MQQVVRRISASIIIGVHQTETKASASLVSAYGVKDKDKKNRKIVEKQGGLFGKSKSAAMGV